MKSRVSKPHTSGAVVIAPPSPWTEWCSGLITIERQLWWFEWHTVQLFGICMLSVKNPD